MAGFSRGSHWPAGPQGPTGPPGQDADGTEYPGVTIIRTGEQVTSVEYFLESAKINLAQTAEITRTGGSVTSIEYYDDTPTLIKTKTIERDLNGAVVGVIIT